MKKLWRYVKPLRYNTGTWHTDRHCQSDRMYIARQHCCNKGLWRIRAFFTTAVARFRFFHPELLRKFSCLIVYRADVINLHRVRSLRRRFCHSTQLNYRTTSPWDVAAMKSAGVDVDRSFHLLQADISSFHASLSTCYIMWCHSVVNREVATPMADTICGPLRNFQTRSYMLSQRDRATVSVCS